MSRTALITGITGQDGSYLAELLLGKGYAVHGLVRRTSNLLRSRIEHLRNDPAIYGHTFFLHYSDLSDATTLRRIFQKARPQEVYHLAGQSHVGLSFEIPESTCEEVGMATLRLLEICRDQPEPVRVYHASTSEIFGATTEAPQTEETAFRPTNPYGCAKAFATHTARVYREAYGLFVSNGILYNHESPRRGENFVTRKITRHVAEIKLGRARHLPLGNIHARRDWGHAADYVRAMWQMLQHSAADDFIVATGETHTVLEFAQAAFEIAGLPWREHLVEDATLQRRVEPSLLVGDAGKIRRTLGWQPTRTFHDLIREMVESDLASLAG
jgi:GDPmannose 4,6-dehydratase